MFYGCPSGLRKTSFSQPSFTEGKFKTKTTKNSQNLDFVVTTDPFRYPSGCLTGHQEVAAQYMIMSKLW